MSEVSSLHCLTYDPGEARLMLVRDSERHEIQIRAQAHRLVRYMAERNAALGEAAALCTHDELMHAVWADEPMHSREELAKLVWEVRKKLEPFAADDLIENERGLGYRLRTCPPPDTVGEDAGSPTTRRVQLLIGSGVLAGGAALAVAIALATRGPGSTVSSTAKVGPFVDRIENVLDQSAEGRQEIATALRGGLACTIPPHEVGRRIDSVAENRQSILQQLGSLQAPTTKTDEVVTLLQKALQESIEADRHYGAAFLALPSASHCPVPRGIDFRLAARSDAKATRAKAQFVAAFDPIARKLKRSTWTAGAF